MTTPRHDIKLAIEKATRALGNPIDLRCLNGAGEGIAAVGRWRHGDAVYERPATCCFQLIMNVSGGHIVDQIAPGIRRSARIEEGSVGMLAPDRASILRVRGRADVVVMFLAADGIVRSDAACHQPPADCFDLSLLDFHAALTKALVAFGLSREPSADALAVAATEAIRGITRHQGLAERGYRRGGLSPHIRRGIDRSIQDWLEDADGPPPRLRALAEQAGLSPSHFLRSVCVETGTTPGKTVQARRLRQALRLLLGSSLSVADIGDHLGYSSPSHFINAFRRALGGTPGTVRSAAKGPGPCTDGQVR